MGNKTVRARQLGFHTLPHLTPNAEDSKQRERALGHGLRKPSLLYLTCLSRTPLPQPLLHSSRSPRSLTPLPRLLPSPPSSSKWCESKGMPRRVWIKKTLASVPCPSPSAYSPSPFPFSLPRSPLSLSSLFLLPITSLPLTPPPNTHHRHKQYPTTTVPLLLDSSDQTASCCVTPTLAMTDADSMSAAPNHASGPMASSDE